MYKQRDKYVYMVDDYEIICLYTEIVRDEHKNILFDIRILQISLLRCIPEFVRTLGLQHCLQTYFHYDNEKCRIPFQKWPFVRKQI